VSLAIVLFEDHTAQHFRPLSWSVPVHELPCGLFHLRERLGFLLAERDDAVGVLLPRGLLQGVQDVQVPAGWTAGPDAARAALQRVDRVLWLSSRLAGRGHELTEVLARAATDQDVHDDDGLLLRSGGAAEALALLDAWRDWDAAADGDWVRPNRPVTPWRPEPRGDAGAPVRAWRRLWDRVPELGEAIAADAARIKGKPYAREIFGVAPAPGTDPVWRRETMLRPLAIAPQGVTVLGDAGVWTGVDVTLDPGVVLDARHGPIVLEREVTVKPHVVLAGPLALAAGAMVKSFAAVGPEVVVGPVGRVAGEIAESQLLPFANKQHAGFLGHALVGSWTNLGADTTNSDLKNNYGLIKVNAGLGPEETGTRFLGLMMGEHAKSAIGTTFNTATTVGFAANVFAAGFPRACIGNFSWGDGRGKRFEVERALETAAIVMGRRGAVCTPAHADLFRRLHGEGA